ncbi:hypothetical protein Q8791_02635 [Nocardiopsis sp. CT-R113]|uniref:Uncharacterized protein n=1 Tax=Nocardiopsis codii TaxID=3065942 RepID=A0ABU7K3J4_9ACTN|nr:hypothetical protein [Nocardiopsis sp. CT-R113]MEE2036117.1 hypothetical protein [Nocardiopsis sp. CT-R113]
MSSKKIKSIETTGDVTTITYEDGTTETQTKTVKADRMDGVTMTIRPPKGWGRK